jgi:Ca2+-binding EF-hand superfamily protein
MRILVTGALLAALLAGPALAQEDAPPPPPPPMGSPDGPPPPSPPMMQPIRRADVPGLVQQHFAMMDLNRDGVIDDRDRVMMVAQRRAEREARIKADRDRMFAELDTNHDGQISRAEFDAPPPPPSGARGLGRPGGPGGPGRMGLHGPGFGMMGGRLLDMADANDDGRITLAEAQKAALAAFDRADVNHDGVVDRDEMVVAMHDRGRWGRDDDRRGKRR